MFKRIISVALLLTLATLHILNAQRITADKIVAVVGNSHIMYSEVVERSNKLLAQRREQSITSDRDPINEALEGLLLQKLLYNQALIDSVGMYSAGGILASVEGRVNQMIEEAGSISALEAREGKSILYIREDLKIQVEEAQYAEAMYNEVTSNVKITPGEVERFYKGMDKDKLPMMPEQYVYAQIIKYPTNSKDAKQKARERLLDMRERIVGGTRFDMLARAYSEDTGSAQLGGEMDYMPLNGFVEPFSKALENLQTGQVSEVVETEFGFHIIQLLDKKNGLYKCRHILIRPIFTDDDLREGDILLDSLAKQIRSGGITFEVAAKKHSDDKYSKFNGGVVTNHELLERYGYNDTSYSTTKFYKEDLRDNFSVIRKMNIGDVSDSFRGVDLRGNALSRVVKLINIIPAHTVNLQDDYFEIEKLAIAEKQEKIFEQWLNKKITSMYIKISPEFRDGEFANKNWVK